MPLKLTAGVSKKLGLPGYSSVGAMCHVELELDSGLIEGAPEAFLAQVRHIYAQCAESVDEELARHQVPRRPARTVREIPAEGFTAPNGHGDANGHGQVDVNGNGFANGDDPVHGDTNGDDHPPSRTNGKARSRPSARQLEYVQDLARQVGMDAGQVEGLCQRLFAKTLGEISGGEASGLIRALQEMRESWLEPVSIYRSDGE
jgi:hypothetical protein